MIRWIQHWLTLTALVFLVTVDIVYVLSNLSPERGDSSVIGDPILRTVERLFDGYASWEIPPRSAHQWSVVVVEDAPIGDAMRGRFVGVGGVPRPSRAVRRGFWAPTELSETLAFMYIDEPPPIATAPLDVASEADAYRVLNAVRSLDVSSRAPADLRGWTPVSSLARETGMRGWFVVAERKTLWSGYVINALSGVLTVLVPASLVLASACRDGWIRRLAVSYVRSFESPGPKFIRGDRP